MPRLSKIGAAAAAAFGITGNPSVPVTYLQVAGGGGGTRGTSEGSGGGGAGGLLTGTTSLNPTLSYTVVVGAGAASNSNSATRGNAGSNSQFGTLTAAVGGGGGASGSYTMTGGDGGSGGGGGYYGTAGGNGTSGQGNNGGAGEGGGSPYNGGGGGGAGSAGSTAGANGGNGGNGSASSITGSSITYAGGGGGGSFNATGGTGGTGGGGSGSANSTAPISGTSNLGGGGGGGNGNYDGASGGSGIVIISYAGAQQFGGGVVTSSGGNTIHTFNTSGTLSPLSSLSASYLIVAGGAPGGPGYGGGGGGGGGAGGLLSGSGLTIDTNSTYVVTVGSGGAGGTYTGSRYSNGSNSTFSAYVTAAVGGGAGGTNAATTGASGGSGGGGGCAVAAGGAGTSGQGNTGGAGAGTFGAGYYTGGGGGGAGAVGQDGQSGAGGAGGVGVASSISGTSTYYAGGGGGGGIYTGSVGGAGGNGGGGAGAVGSASATSGTANTGGGGGGTSNNLSNTAGSGGSGIVIISYAGSVQQMAGGTVTISGGNVIHTFTSSGYLTPLKYVGNSLRFRSSASAYLSRTPASAGNSTSFTYSLWVKRGILSAYEPLYHSGTSNANGSFVFGSNDTFSCQLFNSPSANYGWSSTMVFRDPASWYHIVIRGFASSSSNSYGGVELALYVNGVQQTFTGAAFNTPTTTNRLTDATAKQIGGDTVNTAYYDGYLSEFNYIDGQALTPNSFGTFNSYGVWQPITYGGSYGTNGFYLPFKAGSSTYVGSFNGTSQYLSVPSFSINWSTYGNFTIEGYFNITNWSSANPVSIFGTNGSGNTIGYVYSNGSIGFGINGVNEFISATGLVNAGIWYHIAFVRNGTNITIYLDGVAVASTSSASTYLSNTTNYFLVGFTLSPYYFKGYMSNFRFTNTVVYTGNFTPSTTGLTAITGTQLLTLQNSTIVDNSSNAYSITNNGTVTTSNALPFAYAVYNDQGPAGNNWTPNNISGTPGSTLDYMTDVPTLTSATAANYCVVNPLDKGTGITLSNGNLTHVADASGNWYQARSTFSFPTSGKYYWEFTYNAGTAGFVSAGIAPDTMALTMGFGPGTYGNVYGMTLNGTLYTNNSSSSYGSSLSSGDVFMVAFDRDNSKIYFGKNGTWFNSSDPATQTNPAASSISTTANLFPFVGGVNSSGGASNFGQQPFTYTPPSGYLALNTYNL